MKKKRTNRMLLETEDEEQRYGTKFEDMYWIDPKSVTIIAKEIESCAEGKIEYAENVISKIQQFNYVAFTSEQFSAKYQRFEFQFS